MKSVRMNGPSGASTVRPIRFEGNREQVTRLARFCGYFNFSDPGSQVFRAQSPNQDGNELYNGRHRVTLPDFDDLGRGAWKLLQAFTRPDVPRDVRATFFKMLGDDFLDCSRDAFTIGRDIADAALGVLTVAEKRGWL